jgi:hypothetical protein
MSSPLTPKQQREASLAAKRAEFAKKQSAEKRNRFLVIGSVILASVAIVAVVATIIVTGASKAPAAGPTPGAGVQTWTGLASTHVQGDVKYDMDPPVGGPHDPVWLNCGVYTEPQRNENAVHSLEHGAVWVTYDPKTVTDAQLAAIKKVLPDSYAILSPYPGLSTPFAISAWGAQLRFEDPSDPAVVDFITTYWRSPTGPEPTAPCDGALDGPGKVS